MSRCGRIRALARFLAGVGGCVALASCNASLPGPAQSPAAVPSTLDTGTPAKSNVARVPVADSERA